MRPRLSAFFRVVGLCGIFCLLPGHLRADVSRDPDLAYAYPAGGKKGSVVDVTVGGQNLEKTYGALVSGEGIKVTVTGYSRPLPAKRSAEFREVLAEHRKEAMESMQMSAKKTGEDIAAILQEAGATDEEIRLFRIDQTQRSDPKRQDNKQLVENVTLRIEIPPDTARGPHSLRLFGKNGISNPLTFIVGDFPEERQPGSTEPVPATPPKIRFPVVLNGQIMPGQSDRYWFHANKGERLVFVAQARDLIPYLADAVPGWFQAVITIFDSTGREMASAQSCRFAPDPVLAFDVKESGDFQLEIRDSLHRGREDFVYRLTAGRIPFITGIFPLGGRTGSETTVEVSGWNLPRQLLSAKIPAGEGLLTPPQLANGFATMDVSFARDTPPETFAVEPDNDAAHAGLADLPTTINGRIESPGDIDMVAVNGKKGEPIVIEVIARKLNSPLDSFLRVTDSSGTQVAYNDDREDPGAGVLTHHADSRISFEPPADGLFYVQIGDAQRQGGPDFAYRLRIDRPRPDFALRVVPSGITGTPGTPVPVTVYALRKDGFSGDIQLAVTPSKFTISGGCIPSGSDSVTTTITFPDTPMRTPEPLEITGTAEIGGKAVSHKAVPADDMLQAFFYHHLVPTDSLLAYSPADRPPKRPIQLAAGSVKMAPQNAGHATVLLPPSFPKGDLKAVLKNPPEGIRIEKISPSPEGIDIQFQADPEKVKPGTRGNLLVELTPNKSGADKEKWQKQWLLGLLPAIPYEFAEE